MFILAPSTCEGKVKEVWEGRAVFIFHNSEISGVIHVSHVTRYVLTLVELTWPKLHHNHRYTRTCTVTGVNQLQCR